MADNKSAPFTYTFKKPASSSQDQSGILTEDEARIKEELEQEFMMKVASLEQFLELEYAYFHNKVNNCMIKRCYNDITKQRSEINQCLQLCQSGIPKMQLYIDTQMNQVSNEFQECIQKGGHDDSWKCFENLNNSFHRLKLNVRSEFNFYQ